MINISCNNVNEAIEKLNLIHEAMNDSVRKTLIYAVAAGSIYHKVKKYVKNNFVKFVQCTKFSYSWVKFFMKLFKVVDEYPGLQQCGLPLYQIQRNMRLLSKYISLPEYSVIWKEII